MRTAVIILVVLILGVGVALVVRNAWQRGADSAAIIEATSTNTTNRSDIDIAEEYIRANISNLSSEKEVLGGKFIVTNVSFFPENKAVVYYEDGHNAFIADLAYTVDANHKVTITSFESR
ncbi:hypothetical protein KW782_02570 [Candidatus Parcubacteria bacterium]|nr:hypothetical protein [Candidatus Parcubacteria bacterium]